MNFKISKSEIKQALDTVSKAVALKPTIPALSNVLFELSSGELKLTAYDLEIGITTVISAETMESGKFLAQPKLLSAIINKMPKDEIEISVENEITIKCGKTTMSMPCQAVEEFPNIPNVDGEKVTIDGGTLKGMINQTIFAVATNDVKPILTGLLFEASGGNLNVVGIDGYRLSLCSEKVNCSDFKIVVPARALSEVARLANGNCSVGYTRNSAIFEIGDYKIFTRLLEGEFHNYKGSIPNKHTSEITAHRATFVNALERCQLLVNDRIKSPVRCVFEGSNIKVHIATQFGKLDDDIEAEIIGEKCEIGFNAKYMLDALKAIDDDKVKILLSGANKPAVIKAIEGDSYTMLVLPVRLKND